MNSKESIEKKKEVLEELERQNGVVTVSCNNVGLNRTTFYDWLSKDPEFKARVDELNDVAIDFVESKLFERIKGYSHPEDKIFCFQGQETIVKTTKHYPPSESLIAFYLETRAKSRGYVKKTETEHTINTPVDLSKFSDEELTMYLTLQNKLEGK